MKQSTPRRFIDGAKAKSKKPGVNTGIFSKSGAGQKRDAQMKPSAGSKAPLKVLNQAVEVPKKKTTGGW